MPHTEIYALVMAGGSGTRFWPASRRAKPKQFLRLAGERAMLAETCARLAGLVPWQRVLVIAAESQAELVRAALPQLPRENLLCEPVARNTAPCLAWAALEVERRSPGALQIALPADHVIEPASSFRASLAAGAQEAQESGALVTFGIRPTYPATGYGYIESGERVGERGGIPVHAVARFVEKPPEARAREFLASGRFTWNAGIFAWRTDAILAELERNLPEVLAGLRAARDPATLARVYASFPSQPIDVAVMERARKVRMLPIDYRWSDVGSWAALPELAPARADGNHALLQGGARLVAHEASGCVAWAEGERVIALVGVQDLIVVQTENATLVCPRDRAQDVKKITEALERERLERFL